MVKYFLAFLLVIIYHNERRARKIQKFALGMRPYMHVYYSVTWCPQTMRNLIMFLNIQESVLQNGRVNMTYSEQNLECIALLVGNPEATYDEVLAWTSVGLFVSRIFVKCDMKKKSGAALSQSAGH